MLQKEKLNNFTGFVANYSNGAKVYEREDYFSKKLKKNCATNWVEIDKDKLSSLELVWKGVTKVKIDKAPCSVHKDLLRAEDWFFSQNGYMDMGTRKIVVLSRNIGFIEGNHIYITSVFEETGDIRKSIRVK